MSLEIVLSSIAVVCAGLALQSQSPATYFPAAEVDASFAKGGTLLESGNVRVMTATRTTGGEAEAHATDVDVFHVLEGTATFLVGGTITGAHDIRPGETRGPALEGGTPYDLKPGDVIMIPAGVPHWFKAVTGRFRYYVVKVGKDG
jgi:quercetin dioxygenase-like cupin family protein